MAQPTLNITHANTKIEVIEAFRVFDAQGCSFFFSGNMLHSCSSLSFKQPHNLRVQKDPRFLPFVHNKKERRAKSLFSFF